MRIAFVHCLYENLGIEYLSSYLKREGHEVSLFFDPILFDNYLIKSRLLDRTFNFKEHLVDAIVKDKPDVVAFSVLSDNYSWCCSMAKEIKKRLRATIVFGGVHPTAVPHHVIKNDFVDFVVCGEGEEAMGRLMSHLSQGKDVSTIRNLCYKNGSSSVLNELSPPLSDLNLVPFPDKDLFFNEYKDFVTEAYMIITARGCIYRCSYCCENLMNKLYGRYHRRRSPDNVIEELVWAKKKYGIHRVNFQDSVFTYNRPWLEEFLPQYKEKIALPFFCFIYPSGVVDEKLVGQLTDAGCVSMNMGVQSINPQLRKQVFLRNESNEEITRIIRIIKKTSLYLYLDFVLFPLQRESELRETMRFCSRMSADFVTISWLRYYPGTEIIDISKELGILNDEDIQSINEGRDFTPYFKKKNFPIKTYSKMANLIAGSGWLPPFLMNVIIKFKLYYLVTSKSLFLPIITITGSIKQLFRGKTPYYKSIWAYFGKYYYVYMKRKLMHKA